MILMVLGILLAIVGVIFMFMSYFMGDSEKRFSEYEDPSEKDDQ